MGDRDLRAILEYVDGAANAKNTVEFARFLAEHTHHLIPGTMTGVNFIDIRHSRAPYIELTAGAPSPHDNRALIAAFERHICEHPLINYYTETGDGRAVQISDFLSDREFHELGLYRECFRHIGVEKQIAISLDTEGDIIVGLVVTRDRRDFDAHEVELFDMLRPYLRSAFRNVRRLERLAELEKIETGPEWRGRGIIVLDALRRIRFATPGAQEWLAEFFGPHAFRALPNAVDAWARSEHSSLSAARGRRRIALEKASWGGSIFLTLRVRELDAEDALRGFTARERRVASYLRAGSSTAEIASALSISTRTVHKHLEHIYEKLGVRTRTAAVAAIVKLGGP